MECGEMYLLRILHGYVVDALKTTDCGWLQHEEE
jgi:hypothetical protein